MIKLTIKLIVLISSIFSIATMSQTYRACTEGGGCNYYTPPPSYLDPYTPGSIPNNTMYGTRYSNEAYQQKLAAEKAGQAAAARAKKRYECKTQNETLHHQVKIALLNDFKNNTNTCNNYYIAAGGAGVVGVVTAIPTFGYTAAVATSASISLGTAGAICQTNADGAYAEQLENAEYTFKQYDLTVCEQI